MTKARLLVAALVMVFGAGAFQAADAQLLGTYGGQRADGTPVTISLSRIRDQVYITSVQVQANTTCKDGTTFDTNTFAAGLLQTVTAPTVTLDASDLTIFIGGTLVFDDATRSVSGFLFEKLSKLAAAPGLPTKATICAEGRQAFAAVLDKQVDFDPKLMTWSDDGRRAVP